MTVHSSKKRWLVSTTAALCISAVGAGMLWAIGSDIPQLMLSDHPFLKELQNKLEAHQTHYRNEKLYLHLNKTFFEPGEDVWLAAYIRDARTFKMSEQSDIVHVELLNPKGAVIQKITLIGKEGKAAGDFNLPASIKGGIYKIKAYTTWQQNAGEFFEREIQVQKPVLPNLNMKLEFDRKGYGAGAEVVASLSMQSLDKQPLANYDFTYNYKLDGSSKGTANLKTDANGIARVKFNLPKDLATNDGLLEILLNYKGQAESISRSIPIVLGNIDLSFFPEGGQLLADVEGGVAFKALNEFGKPTDVTGEIIDEKGNKVADFSTYHQGLGALRFKPQAGQKYSARITQPTGIDKKYALPQAEKEAYTVNVEAQAKDHVTLGIYSHQDEELFLVGQARGKVYHSQTIEAKKGANSLFIDTRAFPIGITQFTLFDSKKVARAERLAFVNPHNQLNVKVKTDKEKYLPREKVNMTVEVSDENGKMVSGDFSVAVVDDKLLTFADDKQGNLLSYMLLESDLKGKIEEPNFYFDNENDATRFKPEISRAKALDHLMMTHGWRRFTWKEVADLSLRPNNLKGERAIVAGRIIDATGKPVKGAKLEVRDKAKTTVTADDQGNFVLNGVELYEAQTLEISAPKHQTLVQAITHYQQSLQFVLYGMRWVSGIIFDENSKPVAGALVKIPSTDISVKTGADGKYKIECAQNITYLEVHKEKYSVNYVYPYGNSDVENANAYLYSDDFRRRQMAEFADVKKLERAGGGGMRKENVPMVQPNNIAFGLDAPPMIATGSATVTTTNAAKLQMEKREAEDVVASRDKDAEVAVEVADEIMVEEEGLFDGDDALANNKDKGPVDNRQGRAALPVSYYRAREFAMPDYKDAKIPELRSDFRQTIYWNPSVRVENGRAQLSFFNSDDITQFRVSIEGFSKDGNLGRCEYKYFTQMPFEMVVKIPREALMGDVLSIPLALTNNTDMNLTGELKTNLPSNMRWKNSPASTVTLNARESKTVFLQAEVLYQTDAKGSLEVHFKSAGLSDGISKSVNVNPRGFPMQQVFTGKNLTHKFQLKISDPVQGSIKARVRIYPSSLDEVMQGISSLIRMPGGCFEQTSSSNYPNILALNYLRETNTSDPKVESMAKQYLDEGYKRLTGYESPGGGFDWWGRNPAHEALTAYGLMQFVDMSEVYDVDKKLISRTADWLLSRRDNKGSWNKNPNCLHTWANSDITDAYIVYALAESGFGGKVAKEIDKSFDDAVKSEDPYMMALMANALLAIKDSRAETLLKEISKMQQKDGSFKGLKHSIVNSTGKGLDVETTSLVCLAMLSNNSNLDQVAKAMEFLNTSKDFYGYGSTQGTVLTLKAMLEYTKASKKAAEDGTLAVYLGDKKLGSISYKAGQKEIDTLEFGKNLAAGDQVIELRYEGTKSALPFDVELTYATRKPNNSDKCPLALNTELGNTSSKMGSTVRLTTTLKNTTNIDQPVTMAMVGIPAGLSLQPWQLKELQDKKAFDYYEIFKGFIVFHFERMNPNEVRTINLDLKADIPGTYEAPASCAFLYYSHEHRNWDNPKQIEIVQ